MSAIDTPPGLGLAVLLPHGTFAARRGPRRLAELGLRVTLVLGAIAIGLAVHRPEAPQASTCFVGALTMIALGTLGVAVRRAQVTIAADGVSWGWGRWTVRMDRDRIVKVELFDDAIALRPRRGSTWFLSRRDWDRFEAMRRTAGAVGLPAEEHTRRAPLAARLQSYGRVLDAIIVLAMGTGLLLVFVAAGF
ncbi:MAG: hypothetical protein K8M05_01655 [Deltaproteobacteria bacterium]|nr:hypothetical protein [Kofleriaceae bacterium]